MELSNFGQKLCGPSGINQLMDDLGKPFPKGLRIVQMGGGNPARIPEVEKMYRSRMEEIMQNGDEFESLIGRYDAPQGRTSFLSDVAEFLSKAYGWKITAENVAVANGSQSAFFYLFNMFAGTCTREDGSTIKKKIVFPLVPEYVGYADQCVEKIFLLVFLQASNFLMTIHLSITLILKLWKNIFQYMLMKLQAFVLHDLQIQQETF